MKITTSPSGKVIKTPRDYNAFIPNPLPPNLEWDTNLVNSLSRADFILGKLAREGSKLPNPHLLIKPFVTREAVYSSRIEGTQASISDILANRAGVEIDHDPNDLLEVQNYIKALNYGIKRLEELPLSLRLIKELHEILMQGARGAHATPGEFRHSQNWIGLPGCTLNTAKFVPPPPEHLAECLGAFEKYLHSKDLPPLIHVALCHYQFEAIHPFLDGNGRVGRLLISLLLIERNILPSPLLYVSAFFEATRMEYYNQLYNVSAMGLWNDWIEYFLNGVANQSEDVLSRAERINQKIADWKKLASNLPPEIIETLASNPFVTAKGLAKHLNSAYSTAQRTIQKLVNFQILTQVNEKKRDKVYCANEILIILEEPAKM